MSDEQRALELIHRAWADGLAPDARISLADWCDENVVLSEKDSSEPGQWRTARVPFLREIMDALSPASPVRRVAFMKGTQIAGTSAGKNWLAYLIANRGGPTMYLLPTSNIAKRISKTRIAPMIEDMEILRDRVREKRSRDSGNTVLLKEFDGGVLIIAGANSAAELRSQPIRNLFADEVDAYPLDVDGEGAPLALAEKRTDTFCRKKIFIVSTPTTVDGSVIATEFAESDQRHYYVPCPHCAHMQRLHWERMAWQIGQVEEVTCSGCGAIGAPGIHCEHCGHGLGDQQVTVRDTGELLDAWYRCEACDERIDEWHKTAMLEAGEWRAHAPGIGKARGYHLSALYSPLGWFSWRDAVRAHLKAERTRDPVDEQVFVNTVLGLAYTQKGEQPEIDPLVERAKQSSYRLGQVPAWALMLTAFADVQADRIEVYVYGWGRGESAALIDFLVLYGDTSVPGHGAWPALADVLDKGYRHAGGMMMRIAAMGVDSGYNAQTVYMFARAYKRRHVLATKGQSQPGKPVIGAPTRVDINCQGKKIKKGVKVWPLGVDTGKALVYARLKLEPPAPGAWLFPQGLPDLVFDQLTAEKCLTRYVRGFPVRIWTKDKNARNEALDCAVGAYAVAVYAGLQRQNWDKLEQLINPQQRDLLTAPGETKAAESETISENYETPAPPGAPAAVSDETPPDDGPPPQRPPAPARSYLATIKARRRGGSR